MAANESELQAAAALEPSPTPPAAAADARPLATLDPRLLMVARRGDSKALKDLLQLNDDDDQHGDGTRPDDEGSGTPITAAAASTTTFVAAAPSVMPHVIVQVDPRRDDAVDAPLPSPPVPVLHEDEATTEGESLLVHRETVEQVVIPAPPPHEDDAAALPVVLDEDGVTTEEGSLLVHSKIVEQVVVEPPPHDDAAPPARQPPAAAPAASFPAAVPVLDEDGVTMEGDSLLHVVAACSDTQEFLDCAKMIVRNKEKKGGAAAMRLALEAPNNRGDTPLHCAARAGNVKMIACLVDLLTKATGADKAAVNTFLGRKNRCGETALHQAVRAASKAAIDKLLSVDPELAEEDAGGAACSPFFLAVSLWGEDDEMDIARHLFLNTKPSIRSNPSYYCSGPDGRNVLHAAVSRASVKTVILLSQLLTSADPASVETQTTPPGRLLLSQLASQGDKENGSTPLHLAASLLGLPASWLPFPPRIRPPPPGATPLWPLLGSDPASPSVPKEVSWLSRLCGSRYLQILPVMLYLVLNANETMAYQSDKAGLYPIHVAAGSGSPEAVEMLLERCPDCATLRDAKGRTLLHVAAEEGRSSVVNYVCQQSRRARPGAASAAAARLPGLLSSILNAQDINGDTPLHRAVYAGELHVVGRLIWNQQVRLDVSNKVGMRPIDVSWTTMPLEACYAWDPRLIIRRALLREGAPYGENDRGDLFRKKRILSEEDKDMSQNVKKRILSKEDKDMSQDVTDAAQVLALFSVLITTVTFASAFTLPGGYRSAGDGDGGVAGTPVLAGPKSYAFDAFILSDTLAFLWSLFATSILLYAGVPCGTLTNRIKLINSAYALMWHAARSLVAAFALGLYVVLLPVARSIAIAIVVVSMIMSVYGFLKSTEGIDAMIIMGTSQRRLSKWGIVLAWILHFLDRFWSYIIIFGLPAIRTWARLP